MATKMFVLVIFFSLLIIAFLLLTQNLKTLFPIQEEEYQFNQTVKEFSPSFGI
jgi:hypothetical protein